MKEKQDCFPAGGIHVLLPVYNEERRIRRGVEGVSRYFRETGYDNYRITIVDNGSEDRTASLALALCEEFDHVDYLRLETKGVGAAFRAGTAVSDKEVIGYMDIDLSTGLRHLSDVFEAFAGDPSLKMVYGSRWQKGASVSGRKLYRRMASLGLRMILRTYLSMKATDACCGFKFFRRTFAEELISRSRPENGWFYVNIELLIRAERSGERILEIPVEWKDDPDSRVDFFATIRSYLRNMRRLRRELKGW